MAIFGEASLRKFTKSLLITRSSKIFANPISTGKNESHLTTPVPEFIYNKEMEKGLKNAMLKVAEPSFGAIWDNDDAEYDKL
ncbi:MAG: hypothetical protein V1872_10295 [bacterium]